MIQVTRLGRHFAARITGVDLSKPLDDDTFEQVRKAFFDNEVVVFPGQKLTPAQQIAFTQRFGTLEHHVRKEAQLADHPEIFILSNKLNANGKAIGAQDAGRFWHSDLSYKTQPSLLSALYAVEIPVKDGKPLGDTHFASTTAAYAALPEAMKQKLASLKNIHSYRDYRLKNYAAQQEDERRGIRTVQEHAPTPEQLASVPDMATPVVRVHPVTGRKGLFVNEGHTSHMYGMPEAEGDALLRQLYDHIIQPEFIYSHHWAPGDLLMWDNVAVQHKATFDYDPLPRLLYRTTVRGPAVADSMVLQ
ncbi:MAG: TauD/TfdA dioxygenase family protein [Betaproteobacteria bacterium]|jgi:taurine dioxygenase|nr:TauD/TfdA family dioxygenase [Betaproteobacteria bacterium]